MTSPPRMKAGDLSEAAILALLNEHPGEPHTHWDVGGGLRVFDPAHPDAPEKVLTAKLRSMVRRGLIRGCGCGCRGDWRTDA